MTSKYKDLLTTDVSPTTWFEKFRFHLLEENLIMPIPDNPAQPTEEENAEIEGMRRKILIHLMNSMDTHMFSKIKNLIAPRNLIDESLDSIENVLTAHMAPKPTILSERHMFYTMKQRMGEETGQYVTKLREQAIKCMFEQNQLNERIRDQFVCGIQSVEAREALLGENINELTLERAYERTIAIERSRKEAQTLGSTHQSINAVRNRQFKKPAKKDSVVCDVCGKKGHVSSRCRAQCYHCNEYGHIKRHCPTLPKSAPAKTQNRRYRRDSRGGVQFKRTLNSVVLEENEPGEFYSIDCSDQFDILNVHEHDSSMCNDFNADFNADIVADINTLSEISADINKISTKPLLKLKINDRIFLMEIDSGACVSVCSKAALEQAGVRFTIRDCNTRLNVANGQKIDVLGKARVCVCLNGVTRSDLELYIVDGEFPALFGRSWICKFFGEDWMVRLLSGLNKPVEHRTQDLDSSDVRVVKLSDTDGDLRLRSVAELLKSPVFEDGLGQVKGVKIRLKLREDARPISEPTRRVPFAIKDKLEIEYKRLIDQGVLIDVKDSPWGTPVVPVPKGETVRVCGDYTRTLNKVMDLKQYPLPTIEECFSKVAGGTKFSKIDIRQAFNNLLIAEEDISLTTLNTHIGQKAWTRIPYGLNNSGAYFQEAMDQILANIPMVSCRVDDIIVSGTDDDDHLVNLNKVFRRLERHGLKVRPEKTVLMVEEVIYLGHRINKNGVSPVKSKVEDLIKTPEPNDVKQLTAFLGAVSYYRRYLPDLATITAPLEKLRSSKVTWRWTDEEQSAFGKLKKLLASDHVVACYNPKLPIKVETDASKVGLGAVISHIMIDGSEKPIEYASRKLSQSEVRYSQIDKEALAIVWAVRRFHYYVYGREFELITDHMPLTHIFNRNKGISEMSSNRLSRYALILMNYNYTIRYRNTKQHANCDMLSRLPQPGVEDNVSDEYADIFAMNMDDSFIDARLIARETKKDPILSKVSMYVLDGWPIVKPDNLNSELSAFWERRDYLSLELDCLTWGNRVIIPLSFRTAVLKMLHSSHVGMAGMKNVARSYIYWPGIDRDIEQLAKTCLACNKFATSQPKTKDHPWIRPTQPWQRIHVDFAQFQEKHWLLLLDSFTKWPEVIKMEQTKAPDTIRVLRDIFSRFGLPFTMVTDNGPQFTSYEFRLFVDSNGIKHICSPTYSPKSNGCVERLVGTWKRSMKKTFETCKDLDLNNAQFLMNYRNTPNTVTGIAPAVRLLNRTLRSRLHQLRPSDRQIKEGLHTEREEKVMEGQRSERKFEESEPVWAQINNDKVWHPVTVTKEYPNSPMYDVSYKNRIIKKHADHLKKRIVPVMTKQPVIEEEKQILRHRYADVMNKDELRTADKQPQETPTVVLRTPERAPDNTQKPDRTPDNANKPVDVPLRRSERLRNKESNF